MTLSETWFIENFIDFELQKYRLLAYLKEVNQHFTETKLYPPLADVIFHHNNLVSFRDSKKLLQEQFPRTLDGLNVEQVKLVYRRMLSDDEVMQELEHIVQYGIKQLKPAIENGAGIYEQVEQQLRLEPVGILPLYKDEGYMLLRYGNGSEIKAYQYSVSLLEHQATRYRSIHIHYVDSWKQSVSHTYTSIKRAIIRSKPELPQPAVYSIETPLQVPLQETLLPIAKRLLVRHLELEANRK